jgi:hypothetical protein
MFPFISASLNVTTLAPQSFDVRFPWSSGDEVPLGTFDIHNLMAQVPFKGGILYPDQFNVAPNATYIVVMQLQNGEAVHGLQVTYQ